MTAVKVMADYGCWPLWWDEGSTEVGNVDPEDFGLSSGLLADLQVWSNEFDATLNSSDPARSGFPSAAGLSSFNRIGEALSIRVAEELGEEIRVRYVQAR